MPVMGKNASVPVNSGSTDFPIKSNPYFPGGGGSQQSNNGMFAAPNAQSSLMGGHGNTMN